MQNISTPVVAPRRASRGQTFKIAAFSISEATLQRLRIFAKSRNMSMSELVEGTVAALMDAEEQARPVEGSGESQPGSVAKE